MKRLMLILLLIMISLTSCFLNQEDMTVNRYALIYSVDYADDPPIALPLTEYDGDDMEIVFVEKFNFIGEHIPNPTKAQILSDITLQETIADSTDITLFYFAGHGGIVADETVIYISRYVYITTDELFEALAEVPGQKVIILDSCNSGGFVSSSGYDVDGLSENYYKDLSPSAFYQSWVRFFSQADIALEYPDIHVISAAGDDEGSSDVGWTNGYFTYYLLVALGYDHEAETVDLSSVSADSNQDGYVTLSELYGRSFELFTENRNIYMDYYSHISGGPIEPILIDYDNL